MAEFFKSAKLWLSRLLVATLLTACGGGGGGGDPVSDVAPQITSQPQDAAIDDGGAATFSIGASGTNLSYQWKRDGVDLAGRTSAAISLAVVTLIDDGALFSVTVRNGAGSVSSAAASLTVRPVAPSIASAPQPASVVVNTRATFTVTARGSATLAYQWLRDGADIAGAQTSSYTTAPTVLGDSGAQFSVRVSNSVSSVLSTSASLTVSAAALSPSFTTQPADQSVTAPAPASYSAVVSGSPTPSVQWQVSVDGGANYADIPGATAGTYTTPSTSTADNGKLFRLVAFNTAGTNASTAARLNVQSAVTRNAFIYTANAGITSVTGYTVDRTTGTVASMLRSPYAGATSATPFLVLHPSGRFLYAVESNQPRTWVYAIDSVDGSLTRTLGSPFTTVPVALEAPVADPSGRFLVFNQGFQLTSYVIDSSTGGLTSAGSLVFSKGSTSLEFSQDSQFMFVQDGSSQLRVLKANPLTLLSAPNTIVPITTGTRLYSRGGYLLAQRQGVGLTSFVVDGTGGLTAVQSLGGYGPNIVAHPSGHCFYLSGTVNGNPPTQSVIFTPVVLNSTTGTLTGSAQVRIPVPGSIALAEYPLQMSPSGDFGYLTQTDGLLNGTVTPVALNGDACTISADSPFNPGPLQQKIVFDPSGALLFNHLTAVPSLFVSTIDPITRVPVQVSGSPFTTSGATRQVVVR